MRAKLAFGLSNGDMMGNTAVAGLGIAMVPAFSAGRAIGDRLPGNIDVGNQPDSEYI